MANTRDIMGEQACLDALVAKTLTSFEDDAIVKVGSNCLQYQSTLTDIKLPQCTSIYASGLSECTNLETVDMKGTGTIYSAAFIRSGLTHLILRGLSKTTLAMDNAFNFTPIQKIEGAIYVDESLLAEYKADTNWSKYLITTLDKYPLTDFSTITESWTEIDAMTQEQIAAKYAVGDAKLIDFGTKGTAYAQIVDFGHDDLANGSGKAKVTFMLRNVLEIHSMNSTGTSTGGWADTALRSYLASDILPLMPQDLQTAIKEVTKYSYDYSSSNTDAETVDKLFIPSTVEVGANSGQLETKATKYTPFIAGSYTTADSSRVKTMQGSNRGWWLRTTNNDSTSFRSVSSSGSITSSNANAVNIGIVFGFCI